MLGFRGKMRTKEGGKIREEGLGSKDAVKTMIYTHGLNRGTRFYPEQNELVICPEQETS